jgi:DNA polymerase III subunit gamma/tau
MSKTNTKKKEASAVEKLWLDNTEDYARKFRPKTFEAIRGQSVAVHVITGMIRRRKIPGAIMFHGPRGCGKTTMARLVAAVVNCTGRKPTDINPCGECSSCKSMFGNSARSHSDYLEKNAGADNGVDMARGLIAYGEYKPRGHRRVIVLDEGHRLTPAAQEALLKEIEEPKDHVIYIICTTEPERIIPTLASRFQKVALTSMSDKNNAQVLSDVCKAEKIELPVEVLDWVCHSSGGSTRECLKNLELVINATTSGDFNVKKMKLDQLEKQLSGIVGVPNYQLVQQYLVNVYSGKVTAAMQCAVSGDMPKPIFLKSCLDVHTNVLVGLLSKDHGKLIADGWVRRYTSEMVRTSGLERTEATLLLMNRMLDAMVEWYQRVGSFQLGESLAGLTSIATTYGLKFKALNENEKH